MVRGGDGSHIDLAYLWYLRAVVLSGWSLGRLGRPDDGYGDDSSGYDDGAGYGDERRASIIPGVLGVHEILLINMLVMISQIKTAR